MSIDGRITPRQIAWLIVTVRTALMMVAIASLSAGVGRNAWMSEILATIMMIGMAWIVITLCLRFPKKSLIEIGEAVLGKYLGKLLGLLIIWFFLFTAATLTRELGEFMTTVFYVETPISVFIFLIIAVCVYGARMGLEAILRVNDVFFLAVVTMWLTLWLLVFQDVDFSNLFPLYVESGASLILKGGVASAAGFMVVLAIGMIFPLINQKQRVFKLAVVGLLAQGVIFTGTVILAIGVWGGGEMLDSIIFHGGGLMRTVSVAGFLERVDAIMMIFWMGAIYIKIAIFFFCFVYGLGQVLQTEEVNLLIMPSGALMFALAMVSYASFPQLLDFYIRGWVIHNWFFIFFIPLGLLLMSILLKKKEGGGQ